MRFLTHRWVHFSILLGLLLCACWFGMTGAALRQNFSHFAFDNLNKAYPRVVNDENRVLIADIDDESLRRIGQWPWPRTDVAALVEGLSALGAKVIAFDGVLAEPDRTSPARIGENLPEGEMAAPLRDALSGMADHDSILAEAIRESGIFVSGFTFSSYAQVPDSPRLVKPLLAKKDVKNVFIASAPRFEKAAIFIPELEKAAAGNGSFMASPDHDGILRSTGMVFSDGKQLYPSLSLDALRIALIGKKDSIKIGETPLDAQKAIDTDYRIVLGTHIIPVERDAMLRVYYRTFGRDQDYLPAYKVVDPALREDVRAQVEGRVILIGSSAEGLKDLRNSAIRPYISGVEIHANIAEQVMEGEYLLRPYVAEFAEILFILGVGLFVIILAPLVNVIALGVICTALIGGIIYGSILSYTEYGLLIDSVYPSLSVFLIFILSVILTYLRTEAERKQVRDAFGLYISPDFMKELTANPDKLTLGGEIRDLSVMFTDIRSFTTISEGLSPQELIQLMNDFLTPMSDLVMRNRGTIDKYMGDAMMAFWNAPLDDADHERHACRAALAMNDALVPINKLVAEKAAAAGRKPVLLNAGIGINSGPAAVGNMGSKQRFAYSALGDTVNLASRLEGQTKSYGVNILIGEATAAKVSDFAVLEMDLIQVKGKTQPVRIFALLGDEALAAREDFVVLSGKNKAMLDAYRARAFKDCADIAASCMGALDGYLDGFYTVYSERARDLVKNPPPADWDGVFVALSK